MIEEHARFVIALEEEAPTLATLTLGGICARVAPVSMSRDCVHWRIVP